MAQAQVVLTAVDRTQGAINSAMKGLKGLGDQASFLKRAFAGVGAVAVGQFLTRTAMQAIQYGDEINKAAIKSGLAAEAISSLAYAAKQSDVDLGSLSTSIRKMQIALSEAATGGKAQKETLDALGLSIAEIKALQPDRQFELIADRISMLTDPADRARAATDLFGKSGAELLPLFEQGAAGIRAAREEAERLGIVLSTEQVQALAEADDALKRFTQSWDSFAAKITSKVAPVLTDILDVFNKTKGVFSLIPGYEKAMIAAGGLPPAGSVSRPITSQKFDETNKPSLAPGFKKKAEEVFLTPDKASIAAGAMANWANEIENQLIQSTIDFSDTLYNELQSTVGDIADSVPDLMSKPLDQMTEFAKAAAQEIQSSFADFLFDPFENGLKGMLSGFLNVIRRMIAEAAASAILKSVFGAYQGKSGFMGAVASALFTKATGGPVSPGTPYLVGERGPELFVPGTSGGIMPNNRLGNMGGGVTVAPVYNIDARGATAELQNALPGILAENNRRIFDELDRRYGIGR